MTLSPEQALKRLSAACSRREICEQDALRKLAQWQVPREEQAEIMAKLTDYGFIDNRRFASAYAEDKLRFNRWGERKVRMALRAKGIDDDIIDEALSQAIDAEEQQETLRKLLEEKARSLRNEENEYKKRQKLIRFALSRGYDYEDIIDNM